jgi:hypothetical protein
MKKIIKPLIFIITTSINPLLTLVPANEHQLYNDFPVVPQHYYPPTGFTNLSFGFPTIPFSQVLANGHLYVAFGAYLGIYEIQSDGTLVETCMKMMPQPLYMIDHDGEYLYTTGHSTAYSALPKNTA